MNRYIFRLEKHTPLVVSIIVITLALMIPLKILSYGFSPMDDALMHVGKAVSGKEWSEVLVLKEGTYEGMDSHYGWHDILSFLHNQFGIEKDSLISLSVVICWLIFLLPAFIFLRRPETVLVLLLIFFMIDPSFTYRLFLGRPFILTIAVLMTMLFLFEKMEERNAKITLISIGVAVALSTWLHNAFHLMVLPLGAVFLTRRWTVFFRYLGVVALGILIGAIMTGDPIEVLKFRLHHLFLTLGKLGQESDANHIVFELREGSLNYGFPLLVVLFFAWRVAKREMNVRVINHPAFILGVGGWFAGVFVNRAWIDWGAPALLIWLCFELQYVLCKLWKETDVRRILLTLFVAFGLYFVTSADKYSRWSHNVTLELAHLEANKPDYIECLPGDNGVFYTDNMLIFYTFFYTFPNESWKYIVGFEPYLMPDEDRKIYYDAIKNNRYADYLPWVAKMKPNDRLILTTGGAGKPPLDQLEWCSIPPYFWVGRTR